MYFLCCKILGVRPGADLETIKSAFRRSAKELHPDVNPSEKANYYFILLKNAYQYLLDHPYTKKEIALLIRKKMQKSSAFKHHAADFRVIRQNRKVSVMTMREVLNQSRPAWIIFLILHILFITVGIYMIARPVFDVFYYPNDEIAHPVSAYFAAFCVMVLGVIITFIFIYSVYHFYKGKIS